MIAVDERDERRDRERRADEVERARARVAALGDEAEAQRASAATTTGR